MNGKKPERDEDRITDYTIVSSRFALGGLKTEVLRLIAKGWEPIGGPFLDDSSGEHCQAMVKRGKT
jgi:hypothetical protein